MNRYPGKFAPRPTKVRLLAFFLPLLCLAQIPKVGSIEIYGNNQVSETEIRKALGVKEGDPLPSSRGETEDRLAEIKGITGAHLFAACCEAGRGILYVGVQERGAPYFSYHNEPEADLLLPDAVTAPYGRFVEAAHEAARSGQAAEDLTKGHSLLQDPKARYIQLGFPALADEHLGTLRKVLRESADPEHRAMAAYLVGYATDKVKAQEDLQYALRDPDDTVRANALRALAAFSVYAQKNPAAGLKVSPTWMVEMLNSVVWTDRNNAAVALVTITENRDESVLQQIRERALPSLIQMARWKHLPHALPPFILTGRVAGVPEAELRQAWNDEKREPVIERATSGKK